MTDKMIAAQEFAELARARREWLAVMDALPDPVFVHDRELRIIRANRAYAERAGMDIREVIGKPYWQMFPRFEAPPSGCVSAQGHGDGEELRLPSGETFLSRSFPILDDKGNFLYAVHVMQDITGRKRAEESLRASEALLQSIIENIPIRVFWKDRDLRYLGCNTPFARDAMHSTPGELIGKTDFDMGWKDQAELYRADDKAVMEQGISKLDYEEPSTTPDGRHIWLRTSKVPLRDENHRVIGVLGIYDDITGQHTAQEQLSWNSRVNSELAALSRKILAPEPFTLDALSLLILEAGQRLTESPFGYAGYFDPVTGFLICPTLTQEMWESLQKDGEKAAFEGLAGLLAWAPNPTQAFLINAPRSDEKSPFRRLMAVPALVGGQLAGQVMLANAGQDYTERDLHMMERLARPLCVRPSAHSGRGIAGAGQPRAEVTIRMQYGAGACRG